MNEQQIFAAALERESADRSAFLDEACGADFGLRQRVEKLLRLQERAGEYLEKPAAEIVATGSMPQVTPSLLDVAEGALDPVQQDAETVSLDFLQPSDQSDSLGRIGTYEITDVIGQRGMGVVLKGEDRKLNRIAAVKVLAPELASNVTARRRFLREAQAAAAITHPHVVGIYAVNESEGVSYLVMEFVDGLSLQERIHRDGALELKEILRIGVQVASGLAAAHAQGLIHRDIKPSNILLENGVERARITDFGLARAVDDVAITKTGEVAGTPQYMSPEQAQGQQVDHRSDLFSLGCVLYAMCAGRSPFRAETTMAMLRRVCDDTPRPIREINPEIPEWLVQIVDRLMAKDAEERFGTAQEVCDLLENYLAHVQNPLNTPPPEPIDLPSTRQNEPTGFKGLFRRRRRWLFAAGALLILSAGLSVTEATGLTEVRGLVATVLRISTPEGTLVVKVEDPAVSVSIDGEALSISGVGVKELRLRPGQYRFQAFKDGEPVKQELVTITRGARRVVAVSVEPYEAAIEKPVRREPPASDILFSDDWTWTEPVNPGTSINSEEWDGSPFLSADGLTLVFSSHRPGGSGGHDLWVSERPAVNAPWSPAVNLGPQVNSEQFDQAPCLTADGLTLLFTSNREGGQGHWDLWMSTRENTEAEWSETVNLGPTLNSNWGEGGPSLSADGLVLLFHSIRPGGAGGNDLWLSRRAALNEQWSEPVPLGAEINTEQDERGPCLSSDGRTLIFHSPDGSGDLWMSRGASPFGPWSKPVNLAPQVNGGGFDKYGTLSADCQTLIYESGRSGNVGSHDLWMVRRIPRIDHVAQAVELAQQGRTDEAAEEFSLALSLAVDDGDGAQKRSAILDEILPSDDLFQRVVELRPDDINLWHDRAQCLAREGRWDEAVNSFRRRLELGPAGAGCWWDYAVALLANDDVDGYRKVCAEILERFSQTTIPSEARWAASALVLIPDAVQDKQRAFALAERAYSGAPTNPYYCHLYAMWLYRTDRLEQAVSLINDVPPPYLEPDSKFANIDYFLAMAHYRLGETDQARRWADRADEWAANAEAGRFTAFRGVWARLLSEELKQVRKSAADRDDTASPEASAPDVEPASESLTPRDETNTEDP